MKSSQTKTVYFITGASGVGKTTLVDGLMKKYRNKPWSFIHFDSIEIPSFAEMEREFGSPSVWQKIKTFEWIGKLVEEYNDENIFFEGQADLQFIRDGFAKLNFENYHIVLVDCSEEAMEYRLTLRRKQPELFTEDMKNWLQYLRRHAKESKTLILDSSYLSPQELLKKFEKAIGL
jgi:deoxyadenosine/deoxycytidine kinase